mmetsp:Transcript_3355/g.3869  ORF Transcript_3355/g.3869 Transcript_3355/m.3869 type:complete len:91 (-) Transcript_3355:325-597(-)|eukprot:Skav210582  [mRNA]  locus=scaffold3272:93252:93524:- [translate_table: standard]
MLPKSTNTNSGRCPRTLRLDLHSINTGRSGHWSEAHMMRLAAAHMLTKVNMQTATTAIDKIMIHKAVCLRESGSCCAAQKVEFAVEPHLA